MPSQDAEAVAIQLQAKIDDLSAKLDELRGGRRTRLSLEEKVERLRYYRSEISLEWTLLSNRLSSYITSQAFLVSAFAVAMGNASRAFSSALFTLLFPIVLCVVGAFTSVCAYPSIDGPIVVLNRWRRKQRRLFLLNPEAVIGDPDCHPDPEMNDFRAEPETGKSSKVPKLSDGLKLIFKKIPEHHLDSDREGPNYDPDSIDDIYERSLHFARYAPRIFFCTWIILAALVIYLHALSGPIFRR